MSARLIWGPRPGRRVNSGRLSDLSDAAWVQMYDYFVCLFPDQYGTVEFESESDSLTDAKILEQARAAYEGHVLEEPS